MEGRFCGSAKGLAPISARAAPGSKAPLGSDFMEADMDGGCACGEIRYRLTSTPIYVHCCHCRWCQRETGAAFALNAMIESDRVEVLQGTLERVPTPSESGKGQLFVRCPTCKLALWSHYAGSGEAIAFIRVGTLDDPDACPPDVHIYTATKQPWVVLPEDTPAFEEYYRRSEVWPAEAIARREAALGKA